MNIIKKKKKSTNLNVHFSWQNDRDKHEKFNEIIHVDKKKQKRQLFAQIWLKTERFTNDVNYEKVFFQLNWLKLKKTSTKKSHERAVRISISNIFSFFTTDFKTFFRILKSYFDTMRQRINQKWKSYWENCFWMCFRNIFFAFFKTYLNHLFDILTKFMIFSFCFNVIVLIIVNDCIDRYNWKSLNQFNWINSNVFHEYRFIIHFIDNFEKNFYDHVCEFDYFFHINKLFDFFNDCLFWYFMINWFFETLKVFTKCFCNNEIVFFKLNILSFNAINACFEIFDNVKNINVIWFNFDIILSLCSEFDCSAIDFCNDKTQIIFFSNKMNLISSCFVFDVHVEFWNTHIIKFRFILFDSKRILIFYEFDTMCFDSTFHTSLLWLWRNNNSILHNK